MKSWITFKPWRRSLMLLILATCHEAIAQEDQFFRVSGPAPTKIKAFLPNGTLIWTADQSGTNYTVQTLVGTPGGGGSNWVDYAQIPATQTVNTNFIFAFDPPVGMQLIPAGSFTMGDALNDPTLNGSASIELPLHVVYVSGFYMDKYDVTLALWQQVFNWATNHGYDFDNVGKGKAENHPVITVDWYDCVKWSNARSEMEGRLPAYYTDATQTKVYRAGDLDISNACVNWNAGYRLPTEAEWEKAARGGPSGQRFPWGNSISWDQGNYYGDPLTLDPNGFDYDLAAAIGYDPAYNDGTMLYISPVGSFLPNGYGLYDMGPNAVQWCWDWYSAYGSSFESDPRGPAISGSFRVLRGGSWGDTAYSARVSSRYSRGPVNNGVSFGGANSSYGFRCARGL